MAFRQTKAIGQLHRLVTIIAFLLPFFLAACGQNDQKDMDGASSDTGAVNFQLTLQRSADLAVPRESPSGDICADYAIDIIHATLMNSAGHIVVEGAWPCTAHEGTLQQIPKETGLTLTIVGTVAGVDTWRNQVNNIVVNGGATTDIGEVTLTYIGVDTAPPYVLNSHMPASFATGVIGTPIITVPFSEDVIAATVNRSTCILTVLDSSDPINCIVRYDATTHVGTLSPIDQLQLDATYKVSITTGVRDKAGIAMTDEYNWNFTTSYACYRPTLSPIGNRRIHVNEHLRFSVNATAPAGTLQVYSADLPAISGNPMTFQDRTFDWTPNINNAGDHPVTFRVCDQVCQNNPDMCASENIVITVQPLLGSYQPDLVGINGAQFNCDQSIGTVTYTFFNSAGEVILEQIRNCSSYLDVISGIPVGENIRLVVAATDANNGSVIKRGEDRNISIQTDLLTAGDPVVTFSVRIINSTGMVFHLISPDGPFMMGSPDTEEGRNTYEILHQITLSTPFYMQNTEVTQGQWKMIMPNNPSRFQACGDNCPVESITWEEAQQFIVALNALGEGTFRLPTEAQWEYAARAGAGSEFAFCATAFSDLDITPFSNMNACSLDPNLDVVGWFCANSTVTYSDCENRELYGGSACDGTHPAGMKEPNAFGLFDTHGNVNEWCQDWYNLYYYSTSGGAVDPTGPSTGTYRVARGGSWSAPARSCRSAYRNWATPTERLNSFGLRLVLEQ